ncbi:prepilin peptidase [Patescibacteria group bacterium]|nr:prepilin peptidase [Patescibacteria group bacterium]
MQLTDPLVIFFFVLGLTFGSFGNVLILRLPKGKKIVGRSQCPKCKNQISTIDLIPVISYILLRGQCRFCKKKISIQYPIVEFVTGVLFVIAVMQTPESSLAALLLAGLLWLLFLMAFIDAQIQGIPDLLNIPFVLLALIFAWFTGTFTILAPVTVAGLFLVQWLVSSGAWVGSGDIILAAGIGLMMGDWERALVAIVAAYIVGALVALVGLLTGQISRKDHIAFGPFLAIGALITILWGEQLLGLFFF